MRMKNIALAGAGSLIVLASLVPQTGEAQIARRVASVRDGKVRMSFATRPDVCGWGDGINTGGGGFNNTRASARQTEDVVYDGGCNEGPARVVLTMRGGDVQKVKTYVGGRWKPLAGGDVDLGNVPAREAVDYLFGLANDGVRDAVFPTTLADSVDVTQRLYDLARNESKNKEARDQAVFWLSQQDDDAAVGMLENILKTASSPDIRDKAIFGLSQHHSGKGFAVLRAYAENSSAPGNLREKAIFWLGQRQGDNGDYLTGLYKRLDSQDLKDKVIFAMSQQRDERSMQWLVDLASNSSESMENRKKALFWAGQSGGSVDRLTEMYDHMREREMKEQMIFVLSQRRESKALDKLMSIAKNDADRDMRRKAMFWLGQSHDPRVSAFLADVINR
jgi:hypothetical protein